MTTLPLSPAPSFSGLLDPPSLLRYVIWRLRRRRPTVRLRLRGGPRLLLRPRHVGNNDYGVAHEVFVQRQYACPHPLPPEEVRLAVDLGANVGFSCLYWLTQYPAARLIAFEPHPGHAAQLRANLTLNGLSRRVEIHQAAAGIAEGDIVLSDEGSSSAVQEAGGTGLPAKMLDLFVLLDGARIDLLKLDIEGGEYPLLADPRFAALRPRALVMEWHGGRGDWCRTRLAALGYAVIERFDHGSHGVLWGFAD
jgi:FkbM family methyltransferase